MKISKDSPIHKYTKIRYHIRERTSSSKFQSPSIFQELPSSSCIEQIENNQNHKEGEISCNADTEHRKSYADIVSQNICQPYKTTNKTNFDTEQQTYSPYRNKQIIYQNRNSNKSRTINNSRRNHNIIPSSNLHNIQSTYLTVKNNTNIRKYAHQTHNKIIKINDIKYVPTPILFQKTTL